MNEIDVLVESLAFHQAFISERDDQLAIVRRRHMEALEKKHDELVELALETTLTYKKIKELRSWILKNVKLTSKR